MTAPRRCLICGHLNEPYAARCSCGASLDVTADESRRVVAHTARIAGWSAALWAILMVVLTGVAITAITSVGAGPGGGVRLPVLLSLGAFGGACFALASCVGALRRWLAARATLAAIPDLPRAALRR
ncbi:MAG: hypothetical protein JNK64_25755 [Myxococcales bacterium]|nr:hypothetical protein [Myxococcales bacterium]